MQKRTVLFLLMASISMLSYGKVVIRGKILNYDGKSLVYYHPTIEGIYTPYWKELSPTRTGGFVIEFENAGLGTSTVSYKSIHYRFFHDSNSTILVEIDDRKITPFKGGYFIQDSVKQAATKLISGDYESINRFYNQTVRTSYPTTQDVSGNYYSKLILKAKSSQEALFIIDSLSGIELRQINELPLPLETENPTIQMRNQEIKEFLINEVHSFYSAIYLNGIFLRRKAQVIRLMQDSTKNPNIYSREWEMLFETLVKEAKENLKPIPASHDYNDLMESMAYALKAYKQYYFPQNPNPLDEMLMDRLFKYDTILISDKKTRFAYELSGLQRFLNDQLFYSPALLHAVYDLQKKYPNSANMDFYRPQMEKLRINLETAQHDFKGGKIINSNYNSFEDLLKRFEGNNVLIDIWATWCHPCIEDFKYKNSIQPYIDSLQLEILYISIDKPEWDDRWRQSIKINQLEGHHFRANSKFILDMWSTIRDFQGAIPRYVLVDKQGNIFKSTAARPSMGDELPSQIAELIDLQH